MKEYCGGAAVLGDWAYNPKAGVAEIKAKWEMPQSKPWFRTKDSVVPNIDVVGEQFRKLASEWSEDTWHISSISDLTAHPSYRKIIDMGMDVVPFLLKDLQQTHRFWFVALSEITKLRPFDPRHAGDVAKMTDAWVTWGKKKRLI
jgi:hypothetical protein